MKELEVGLNSQELDPDLTQYFSGDKLYGDDFSYDQLEQWYEDEKEGYANLGSTNKAQYQYGYHSLNRECGFKRLPFRKNLQVLGLGSAYGHEFIPILNRIQNLTIVDPSDAFFGREIRGIPISYVKPNIGGDLPFEDNQFDLITCFGVLHHIPNVTKVIGEIYRSLRPGGFVLIREPIISMGDWRKPRTGLTKRERGIPINIMRKIIVNTKFTVVHETLCMFSLTTRLRHILTKPVYNSNVGLIFDRIMNMVFKRNLKYHPTTFFQKLKPTSVYLVLSKAL